MLSPLAPRTRWPLSQPMSSPPTWRVIAIGLVGAGAVSTCQCHWHTMCPFHQLMLCHRHLLNAWHCRRHRGRHCRGRRMCHYHLGSVHAIAIGLVHAIAIGPAYAMAFGSANAIAISLACHRHRLSARRCRQCMAWLSAHCVPSPREPFAPLASQLSACHRHWN